MATAVGSSAEAEALKLAFSYLVNSVDVAALLPATLSAHLISDPQRSECVSEPDHYKRAEKFLGHLQRAVNGDSSNLHVFIQLLQQTNQLKIAERLHGTKTYTYFRERGGG